MTGFGAAPKAMQAITGLLLLMLGLLTVSYARAELNPLPDSHGDYQRIVSMNLCTDQMVLALAEPERIASVTYLARQPSISAFADKAGSIPINHGLAEEILPLKPDIVFAGAYTTRPTTALLRRLGYKVVVMQPATGLETLRRNFRQVAEILGLQDRAEDMLANLDRQFAEIKKSDDKPLAVVLRPRGMTTGPNSLVNDLLAQANFENLAARLDLGPAGMITLEQIIQAQPDVIVSPTPRSDRPSIAELVLKHPALTSRAEDRNDWARVTVPEWSWVCGGPQVATAFRLLVSSQSALKHGGGENE